MGCVRNGWPGSRSVAGSARVSRSLPWNVPAVAMTAGPRGDGPGVGHSPTQLGPEALHLALGGRKLSHLPPDLLGHLVDLGGLELLGEGRKRLLDVGYGPHVHRVCVLSPALGEVRDLGLHPVR